MLTDIWVYRTICFDCKNCKRFKLAEVSVKHARFRSEVYHIWCETFYARTFNSTIMRFSQTLPPSNEIHSRCYIKTFIIRFDIALYFYVVISFRRHFFVIFNIFCRFKWNLKWFYCTIRKISYKQNHQLNVYKIALSAINQCL